MTKPRWAAAVLGIAAAQVVLALVFFALDEGGPSTWAQLASGLCLVVVGVELLRQR